MNKAELEERTLVFSVGLIKALKTLPKNIFNHRLSGQVTDSGTSIGVNYREANGAESRRDFKHKVYIAFKEARETKYWLTVLRETNPQIETLDELWQEADELSRIFGSICSSCRQ